MGISTQIVMNTNLLIVLVTPFLADSVFSFYPSTIVGREQPFESDGNFPPEDIDVRKCRPAEVVLLVCDEIVDGWFQPVRKMRMVRDVSQNENGALDLVKRSFSHTSLPFPSRIQFMLKVKKDFCNQVKKRENNCITRAVKRAVQKKKKNQFQKN